jgi:hypothetical protein
MKTEKVTTKSGKVFFLPVFNKEFERLVFKSDGDGLCIACGDRPDHWVEPDIEKGKCEACGEFRVYGLEQLVIRNWVR